MRFGDAESLSGALLLWLAIIAFAALSYWILRRLHAWMLRRHYTQRLGAHLENPENADVRFQMAQVCAHEKSWGWALSYAEEAVRIARRHPVFEGRVPYPYLRVLGDASYHRGLFDRAIEAYAQALEAKGDQGHGEVLFGLGKASYRKGDARTALDWYRKALEDQASNPEIYFRVAQAAALLGQSNTVASARQEFGSVTQSLPRYARRGRGRWRVAFFLFPLTRWLL